MTISYLCYQIASDELKSFELDVNGSVFRVIKKYEHTSSKMENEMDMTDLKIAENTKNEMEDDHRNDLEVEKVEKVQKITQTNVKFSKMLRSTVCRKDCCRRGLLYSQQVL